MTKEQFDELYLGKAVHCKTEELANEFLALANELGYKWCDNEKLTSSNEWQRYKNETCYLVEQFMEISFSSKRTFEMDGDEIIEFKSLKEEFKKPSTNQEKVNYLLKGFGIIDGSINLIGIDFGEKNIYLKGIKANFIYNEEQKANQITNSCQEATKIYNNGQEANIIYNNRQRAFEFNDAAQEIMSYEKMTKEELIKEIKKLKGEK